MIVPTLNKPVWVTEPGTFGGAWFDPVTGRLLPGGPFDKPGIDVDISVEGITPFLQQIWESFQTGLTSITPIPHIPAPIPYTLPTYTYSIPPSYTGITPEPSSPQNGTKVLLLGVGILVLVMLMGGR